MFGKSGIWFIISYGIYNTNCVANDRMRDGFNVVSVVLIYILFFNMYLISGIMKSKYYIIYVKEVFGHEYCVSSVTFRDVCSAKDTAILVPITQPKYSASNIWTVGVLFVVSLRGQRFRLIYNHNVSDNYTK